MSRSCSSEDQTLPNFKVFTDYLKDLNKRFAEEKIKVAEKIFFETYFEYIDEGMNPKVALQKAKLLAFCFLFENDK